MKCESKLNNGAICAAPDACFQTKGLHCVSGVCECMDIANTYWNNAVCVCSDVNSYLSTTSLKCEAKKSNDASCVSVGECMLNVGLGCTGYNSRCQCNSNKYTQKKNFLLKCQIGLIRWHNMYI